MDGPSLLALLQQSQLLSPQQLAIAEIEARAPGLSGEDFARSLIRRRWLTSWQYKLLLAGRTVFHLGKYKLLDEVGKGGMGAVYKAEQGPIGRIVALKMMSSEFIRHEGALARFHREIQAAAVLDHPNIVAAYDADSVRDRHFLVMEYVDGQTLAEVAAKRSRLPIAEACEYIRQAALGLQHAHEKGMVHRDIKPSNLLLARPAGHDSDETVVGTSVPVVKILDMGLARFTSEIADEGGLTQTGQIMGTPDYISPEQARNTRLADIRSDIFSLGCCLFRLLTGALPYGGSNTMEKLMARGMADAPRLRSARPDIPPELDAIVARMLARRPEERYQTPAEVAAALTPFAIPFAGRELETAYRASRSSAGSSTVMKPPPVFVENTYVINRDADGPTLASPIAESDTRPDDNVATRFDRIPLIVETASPTIPMAAVRVSRKASGRGWFVGIGLALGVALLLVGGLAVWRQMGLTTLVLDWPVEDRSGSTLVVDGRKIADLSSATLEFQGDPGRRTVRIEREGYEAVEGTLQLPRGTTKSWKPKWKPTAATVRAREFAALKERVAQATRTTAPDDELAELRKQVHQWRYRSLSAGERAELNVLAGDLPTPLDALKRTGLPDYERTLFQTIGSRRPPAVVVGVYGDSRLKLSGELIASRFSADGKQFVTLTDDGRLVGWSVETGQPKSVAKLPFTLEPLAKIGAISADLTLAVVGDSSHAVRVWDLKTRSMKKLLWDEGRTILNVALDDQNRRVVAANDFGVLKAWDLSTGNETWSLQVRPSALRWVAVSRNAERVAVISEPMNEQERLLRTLAVFQVGSPEPVLKREQPEDLNRVQLSPDGKTLVWMGNETTLHDVDDPKFTPRTLSRLPAMGDVRFSRDGRYAAFVPWNPGDAELWDTSEKRVLKTFHKSFDGQLTSIVLDDEARGLALLRDGRNFDLWTLEDSPAPGFEQSGIASGLHTALLSPDGRFVMGGSWRQQIVWDVATRKARDLLRTESTFMLVAGPDGETIYAGGDRAVNRWELPLLSPRGDLRNFENWVFSVAFSPNGRFAAMTDYARHLTEVDLTTEEPRRRIEGPEHSATYSVDGKHLAAIENGKVRVWETKSGGNVGVPFGDGIEFARFAPTGDVVVTASRDGLLATWSAGDFLPVHSAVAHPGTGPVSVDVSPSGRMIVTTRIDDSVRLWSLHEGHLAPLGDPIQFGAPLCRVDSAFFTPDERHLLLCGTNGTIAVLRLQVRP